MSNYMRRREFAVRMAAIPGFILALGAAAVPAFGRDAEIPESTIVRAAANYYDAREYLTGDFNGGCQSGQKTGVVTPESFRITQSPVTGAKRAEMVVESCRGRMSFIGDTVVWANGPGNLWLLKSEYSNKIAVSVNTVRNRPDNFRLVWSDKNISRATGPGIARLGAVADDLGRIRQSGVIANFAGGEGAVRSVSQGGNYNPPFLHDVHRNSMSRVIQTANGLGIRFLVGPYAQPLR